MNMFRWTSIIRYVKILRWRGPIANTRVWDGILTCANEENGVVFWTVSVRMGWFPDLCQWGGWDGAMTRIREDWEVPWTESMRRMEWCPDLCQWREWGCLLNYVNEEMRWCPDLIKSMTKHRQDVGELRKLCTVRPNECVVQTEYIMCSLTHLQKSFLHKTLLSCSLFSWRHPYFSDVWGKGLFPGMSLNSSLSMCSDICRSSELIFW